MRVYVAGKTQDYRIVRTIQNLCKMNGWDITHDWTKTVEAKGPADRAGHIPMEDQKHYAHLDMVGVYSADVVIALGHPDVTGTLIEVGLAIAWNRPIWTFRWDKTRYTIFNSLENFTHFGEDLPALEEAIKRPRLMELGLPPYDRTVFKPQDV